MEVPAAKRLKLRSTGKLFQRFSSGPSRKKRQAVDYEVMIDGFLSSAGHELRTPLTSILGFSELLLTQEQGEISRSERTEFLEHIFLNTKKLMEVVEVLLDLAHQQSGRQIDLLRRPCAIGPTIHKTLDSILWEHRRETFVELDDPEILLQIDQEKIIKVIQAVIRNAFKFSAAPWVKIRGFMLHGNYQILIEDRGQGIAQDKLERVFDPFFRVDSSDTAPGGLGLGLSWAQAIVKAHGGKIMIDSEPGAGTRVTVELPCA